nr:hypothetical protein [Tanacetum cinerariifolium]
RRNKVNWHYVRDDILFSTIKVVSRHQDTQQYGAILPIDLTTEDIRNTKAYKEYYACATGEAAPKPKASARRKRDGTASSTTPPTPIATLTPLAAPRLSAAANGKQPARATSPTDPSDVERTEAKQLKIVLRRSRHKTHISQQGGSSTDKGTGSIPGVPDVNDDDDDEEEISKIDKKEATESGEGNDEETESDGESEEEETIEKEEESFDPIPRTPEECEDDGNDRVKSLEVNFSEFIRTNSLKKPSLISWPKRPPTPDRDWNKTLPAAQGNAQSWISALAKQINKAKILIIKTRIYKINMRDLKNTVLEKDFKISELEECVRNKDLEIEKYLERLNVYENKLHKMSQTNQTVHMIMPSKDNLYNGRKGIGFENPSYFKKAKDLRPTLYDEKVIGLGYTLMFLTHSDEALEIKKFKRSRENKIEFAYDYGNLNAIYVNEKINLKDDYFQEIINPDFEKIDSPFQQTSSLKPYVPNVILEKIIIDLEDKVVNLLEKEKVNLKTIESLKSKGLESSKKI